jgi:hypothetical protein
LTTTICFTRSYEDFTNHILNIPGGGIVFDSDPYDEWVETMSKLGSNSHTITSAEQIYARLQAKGAAEK